jgi:lipopolysaccharide/colanic/teichoic acid biosynthesis glycosyltransferase
MLKFIFDRLLSLALLPIAIVVCFFCIIAIRIESPGNPLFIQSRVGKNLKPFKLVKLRTMKMGTKNAGSHQVSQSQITTIGRFLRRTKLDELPQVWNVLLGQMSFVGPRPCLPTQTDVVSCREELGVYQLRPGVTGPAQLAGVDMSTPEKLAAADAKYLQINGITRDIWMMIQTVLGKGRGDAVLTNSPK